MENIYIYRVSYIRHSSHFCLTPAYMSMLTSTSKMTQSIWFLMATKLSVLFVGISIEAFKAWQQLVSNGYGFWGIGVNSWIIIFCWEGGNCFHSFSKNKSDKCLGPSVKRRTKCSDNPVLCSALTEYLIMLWLDAFHSLTVCDVVQTWIGTAYFGASSLALERLVRHFGYSTVCLKESGVNIFFVHSSAMGGIGLEQSVTDQKFSYVHAAVFNAAIDTPWLLVSCKLFCIMTFLCTFQEISHNRWWWRNLKPQCATEQRSQTHERRQNQVTSKIEGSQKITHYENSCSKASDDACSSVAKKQKHPTDNIRMRLFTKADNEDSRNMLSMMTTNKWQATWYETWCGFNKCI